MPAQEGVAPLAGSPPRAARGDARALIRPLSARAGEQLPTTPSSSGGSGGSGTPAVLHAAAAAATARAENVADGDEAEEGRVHFSCVLTLMPPPAERPLAGALALAGGARRPHALRLRLVDGAAGLLPLPPADSAIATAGTGAVLLAPGAAAELNAELLPMPPATVRATAELAQAALAVLASAAADVAGAGVLLQASGLLAAAAELHTRLVPAGQAASPRGAPSPTLSPLPSGSRRAEAHLPPPSPQI
ncbi:hypothetical protein T492DRAFT_835391 [Pavlovales sp. CCMP2436]|nr:hypothetical protein T492DRAFT_835391 [Pavlovales sp. CCMP2436]